MATTALQALSYPVGSDSPAGHTQMLALANSVEKKVVMVFASSAARTTAFSTAGVTATEGMLSYLEDTNLYEYHNGSGWRTSGIAQGGRVAGFRLTSGTQATTSGAEVMWAATYLAVAMVSGRRYGLHLRVPVDSGPSTDQYFIVRIRNSKSASNPTTASTEIHRMVQRTGNTITLGYTTYDEYVADTTGTNTLGLSVARSTGTTPEIQFTATVITAQLTVIDRGV